MVWEHKRQTTDIGPSKSLRPRAITRSDDVAPLRLRSTTGRDRPGGSRIICPHPGGVAQGQSKRLIIAVSPVQVRPPLREWVRCVGGLRRPSSLRHDFGGQAPTPPGSDVARPRQTVSPDWVPRGFMCSQEGKDRGCNRRTPEDHPRVRGVQAPELHHQEEPAQRPGPPGDQEVLPELQDAPRAQGNPLSA